VSSNEEESPRGDWEVVAEVGRRYEAELMAGLLRGAGIESRVIDKSFRQGPLPLERSLALVRVWVLASRAGEARRLLAEAEGREGPASDQSGG
jgi:hypothetical protein